jgi:hypothetical protein
MSSSPKLARGADSRQAPFAWPKAVLRETFADGENVGGEAKPAMGEEGEGLVAWYKRRIGGDVLQKERKGWEDMLEEIL